jgi:GNAT superfamily N-acetyltransferase
MTNSNIRHALTARAAGAIPPHTLEEICANSWPALQTTVYDGWLLRYAKGLSKRSNSVWPLYREAAARTVAATPGAPAIDQKISYCEQHYAHLGQPAIFKIAQIGATESLDVELERRGYDRIDESIVQVRDLGRPLGAPPKEVLVEHEFSPVWLEAFEHCSAHADAERRAVARELFARIRTPVVAARVEDGGVCGCGYAVIERGWAGLYAVFVPPERRRRGIGTLVTTALLHGSQRAGAAAAYLQVVADNEPAMSLYRASGFVERYRYWYRIRR